MEKHAKRDTYKLEQTLFFLTIFKQTLTDT